MNYSTIKKTIVFSLIAMFSLSVSSNAQDSTQTTSSTIRTTPKLFGGLSQYRTWSFGINAGILQPVVLTGGANDFTNWDVNLGYGFTLRKQLGHAFGLELSALRGDIAGNNEDSPNRGPNYSFETELAYSAALMGVYTFSTIDFLNRENSVNFYSKFGYGMAAYAPAIKVSANAKELDWNGVSGDNKDEKFVQDVFIPVGIGAKFKISERMNFDLGYNMYYMIDADNLDGTPTPNNSKDKFSYGYAGLEFSLGSTSKPNIDWANPVALTYDELKDTVLRQEVEGIKNRLTSLETGINSLMVDSDGDGVADKFDKCPNTPSGVKIDGSGCPLDSDQDGVFDSQDRCPLEKGTVSNNGCPEIKTSKGIVLTPEEQKIVQDVFDNLEFDTGKYTIRASSFSSLNKLASLLISKPNYNLKISGHTDNVGSDKANLTLSKNRANAVKNYLVKRGASKNRVEAFGYGESQPIADNSTNEGRQQNRRVEFNIE